MQKKLIALAIAGLASTAAFAQTNVTVYGVADASISATTRLGAANGQTQFNVNSGTLSTSRIGFKGVEDLGNGLKALFVLEYGLNIDANAGIGGTVTSTSTNGRQQFVGLTGGFGTAVVGRLQTTGLDFSVAATALGGSTGIGAAYNAGGGTLITSASRANNAIAYISPSFGGVTVAYNHARLTEAAGTSAPVALTTSAGGNTDSTANLLSVSYANGPITAGAIYTKVVAAQTNLLADNVKEWGLRAGYDFKVVKLQALYQQQKADTTATVGKDKKWAVSAAVPIGAKVAVIAEYAALNVGSTLGADNVKVGTLASTYSLSKRTTAYAGVVAKRVQSDIGAQGLDTNTYAVGLRHTF
ncbi:MAG: porin [Gammaproteobacteria bacterium]|jgi:predicted porin|nr:porin [Gammaproteobacteria bacterium]MBU1601090.1 porin [Gammaproteobacteria bacterium]MBU2434449.1 porin [Gammaproteobacteria bacterium]MBU2450853.1 porin [Gammaproteobacteria bacterium]PKO38392.1 MAG: porin [Betaproteobacteria bacterium HGW-Betaproteobacteria-4]